MKLYEIECTDRKNGTHVYEVHLLHEFGHPADQGITARDAKRKIAELFIESSKHDVLFSDELSGDLGAFIDIFINPRSVWLEIIRVTDRLNIGAMYLTDVVYGYDSKGHFTFWDGIGRSREELVLRGMEWAFDRYKLERMTSEIPVYQSGVIRFTRRLGFKEEGCRRHGVKRHGEWVDQLIFGILKEELDGIEYAERDAARDSQGSNSSRRNIQ